MGRDFPHQGRGGISFLINENKSIHRRRNCENDRKEESNEKKQISNQTELEQKKIKG